MKKKKIGIGAGLLLPVLLVGALIHRYTPGKEWMTLEKYYGVEQGCAALIYNTENLEEQGILRENVCYLPLEAVQQINSRFYWDGSELLYTLPDRTVCYRPGETEYLDGETAKTSEKAGCMLEDGQLWIAQELLEQYTDVVCLRAEEPNRLWTWDAFASEVMEAEAVKDCVIRYRAGIKSPILAQLQEGESCLVVDDERVPGWVLVQNREGILGYVKAKEIRQTAVYAPEHSFREPEPVHQTVDGTILMAWHQNLDNSGIYELPGILERSVGLGIVAPSWFTLDDDAGHFISRADAEYVEMAHAEDVQVWAMIDNLNLPVDSYAVLAHTENRKRLIDGLMKEAKESGIDGINVDFENLSEACGVHFIQFIRELAVACHSAGLVLSVDNYAPGGGTDYYDRAEQAQYADYIMVMAYDEHWKGCGEAGSTASYPFTEKAITGTLEEVPAKQLVLAVPFYTRIWTEDADSTAVGTARLAELLQEWKVVPEWSDEERQYHFTAETEDGTVTVWAEDLRTLAWRLELANQYELAGISAWKAGLEPAETWALLYHYRIGDR